MAEFETAVLVALEQYQESFYALSRQDLCQLTGASDRAVRAAVAQLRRQGHLIVSVEEGGYRIAESQAELDAYVAVLGRRIDMLQATIAAMESAAVERFGDNGDGVR